MSQYFYIFLLLFHYYFIITSLLFPFTLSFYYFFASRHWLAISQQSYLWFKCWKFKLESFNHFLIIYITAFTLTYTHSIISWSFHLIIIPSSFHHHYFIISSLYMNFVPSLLCHLKRIIPLFHYSLLFHLFPTFFIILLDHSFLRHSWQFELKELKVDIGPQRCEDSREGQISKKVLASSFHRGIYGSRTPGTLRYLVFWISSYLLLTAGRTRTIKIKTSTFYLYVFSRDALVE